MQPFAVVQILTEHTILAFTSFNVFALGRPILLCFSEVFIRPDKQKSRVNHVYVEWMQLNPDLMVLSSLIN